MSARYHMRRDDKRIELTDDVLGIMKRGKYTSIAMCRDDEPYIVTLSYGFDDLDRSLYFHCAEKGLKMDFLRANPRICGTVVEDTGYRMGQCDQGYRSVVYRGMVSVAGDVEEKKRGLAVLLRHLEKDPSRLREKYLSSEEGLNEVCVLKVIITDMAGKQG